MSAATETPTLEREELRMVLHNAIVMCGADLAHELLPADAGFGGGANHLGRLLELVHFCYQAELHGTPGNPFGLGAEVDVSGAHLYELVRPWRDSCAMSEKDYRDGQWDGGDWEDPPASVVYWQAQREAAERVLDAIMPGWQKQRPRLAS